MTESKRERLERLEEQLSELDARLTESRDAVFDADNAVELNREKGYRQPGWEQRHERLVTTWNSRLRAHEQLQRRHADLAEEAGNLRRSLNPGSTAGHPPRHSAPRPSSRSTPVTSTAKPSATPTQTSGGDLAGALVTLLTVVVAGIFYLRSDYNSRDEHPPGVVETTASTGGEDESRLGDTREGVPTPALNGVYVEEHVISTFHAGEEREELVDDCLSLKARGEGLAFDFLLIGHNGHNCSMAGMATPRGAGRWIYREPIESEGGECMILFVLTEDAIELTDVDDRCREEHCGVNGIIGGARFRRSQKDRSTTCPDYWFAPGRADP